MLFSVRLIERFFRDKQLLNEIIVYKVVFLRVFCLLRKKYSGDEYYFYKREKS